MALAVGRATRKSADLLGAAANAGDTDAQFALGLLYLLGRGVYKLLGEAFHLCGRAAEAGADQAATFRDMAAENLARDQIKQRMVEKASVEGMKEAERRQRFPKPQLVKSDGDAG